MDAPSELLERSIHLVAGRAELVRLGKLETAEKSTRKDNTQEEGHQSSQGYTEQEPSLGTPPEPCANASTRGWRRIHFEFLDGTMSNPSSGSGGERKILG